jgi:hypothetical protein
MCSNCENVLIGFSIPHTKTNCPLLRSSYCSVCCSYGHLTEECPDHEVLKFRKAQFVEQLIPYSLLKHYKITTQTPLPATEALESKYEPEWEIEDTDKAIRQVLMNYSIQPSGKPKENRRLVKQIADERHLKLVYIKCK